MKIKTVVLALTSVVFLTQAKAANLIWSEENGSNMTLKSMTVKFGDQTGSISSQNRMFINNAKDDLSYSVVFDDGTAKEVFKMLAVAGIYLVKITGTGKDDYNVTFDKI